ncbi:amidase signature enzyme [Dendrothele bispora CBS 962.96]|uniref:Amidase signature enzyme n=1 Tax=Dendrothele bispora (strain CBS 962.96) TaxID=1314807 RepID=A0A4S8KMX7_DENBC|nr:amidase signature enzyme [Dendrothele bispora CBS 962.96]
MPATREDLVAVERRLNLVVKPEERDDYLALMNSTDAAANIVMSIPDYSPPVSYDLYPRTGIEKFGPGSNEGNNLRGWACKVTIKGKEDGILTGKNVCIKDNICLAGVPCQFGTQVIEDFIPELDATVATRILEHGGTITGKATCEDMSHGAASFTSPNGPVQNPYAFGFSTGGSSSGCGALIGSGEIAMGIGGDQGGSIRIPASLCGIVGLKATFGLVPYTGVLSSETSLDHVGPMGSTVADVALLLQAIAGYDGIDDRQLGAPAPHLLPDYLSALKLHNSLPLSGVKVGFLKEGFQSKFLSPYVDLVVRNAIAKFRDLGAEVVEVSVPGHLNGGALMHVLNKMGSSQARLGRATARRGVYVNGYFEKLLPWDQKNWDKVHSFVQGTAISGEYAFHKYPTVYGRASNIVRRLKEEYDEVLKQVDVLVMPTVPCTARRHVPPNAGPLGASKATAGLIENTAIFNGTGHPALSIPVGLAPPGSEDILRPEDSEIKLPVGMQIIGKMWDEEMCLRVGGAWEAAWDWKTGQRKARVDD